MGKRYFTVAEANALLPWLEQSLARALMLRSGLRGAACELERLGEPLTEESLQRQGGEVSVANARARAKGLIEALSDELQHLVEAGIEVKDLEIGLCDFVARREGRDVYLCWRLGEKQVGHWHELGTGVAGRQPLESADTRLLH